MRWNRRGKRTWKCWRKLNFLNWLPSLPWTVVLHSWVDGEDAVFPGIALMPGTLHAYQRHSSMDLVLLYQEYHKDLFQHTPEDKGRENCSPSFPELIWVPKRVIYMIRGHKTMQLHKIQIQSMKKWSDYFLLQITYCSYFNIFPWSSCSNREQSR